jgi:hypothetical protein
MLQLILDLRDAERQELCHSLRRIESSETCDQLTERSDRVRFGIRGGVVKNKVQH